MPYNGSGGFTRVMNWVADAAAGTKIKADRHDSEDDNFASGLSNVICRDGQSAVSADIPFNNRKITGLADPVNDQDAVTKKYMLGGAATQGLWTKLGFTSADMSILGRAADGGATPPTKQRIAFNDKADGTGNDVFAINDDGTFKTSVATVLSAETRNRIVNGAMQINQEGDTTSTAASYWAADQWRIDYISNVAVVSTGRTGLTTPNGSKYRLITGPTTADTSLAAGETHQMYSAIEGIRVADFLWGTASARQVVLRFGFRGPAGTYAASFNNADFTRAYVAAFTIAGGQANTDTTQTIVIPGDTTGTWLTDTGVGLYVLFTFASGTNGQGTAGWQAGAKTCTSAISNGMGVAGNEFHIFDVGLYLDPNKTGVAPPWVMPDEAEELRACQRYYEKQDGVLVVAGANWNQGEWMAEKRVVPALTFTPAAGSGASLSAKGSTGWYQGGAHSVAAQGLLIASARM